LRQGTRLPLLFQLPFSLGQYFQGPEFCGPSRETTHETLHGGLEAIRRRWSYAQAGAPHRELWQGEPTFRRRGAGPVENKGPKNHGGGARHKV